MHLFGEAYDMTHVEIWEVRDRFADTLDFERFLDYQVRQFRSRDYLRRSFRSNKIRKPTGNQQ